MNGFEAPAPCKDCDGTGVRDGNNFSCEECDTCGGTGVVTLTPEESPMTEDQINDEFANIFFGDENPNAEWADKAAAEAPKPEPKPLKNNGLSYIDDVVLGFGSVESRYAFRVDGKTLFFVHVELGCVQDAPAGVFYGGQAITWHPIVIKSADGMKSFNTEGRAAMAVHAGGPAHIDGQTVSAFLRGRVMRFAGQLYGI